MKTILKGILAGMWIAPDGKEINTTKIFVEISDAGVKNLIGSQVAEIKYDGDISKLQSAIGKTIRLDYIPNGKYSKLANVEVV